jgi:hypothetical protein
MINAVISVPIVGIVTPAAADEPSAVPAAPTASTLVELAADDGRATIERRMGTLRPLGLPLVETGIFAASQWEHTCIAPCSVTLDPRYAYRVAGDGLVPTDSFALPHTGDRVRVDARMGSSTGRIVGAVSAGARSRLTSFPSRSPSTRAPLRRTGV